MMPPLAKAIISIFVTEQVDLGFAVDQSTLLELVQEPSVHTRLELPVYSSTAGSVIARCYSYGIDNFIGSEDLTDGCYLSLLGEALALPVTRLLIGAGCDGWSFHPDIGGLGGGLDGLLGLDCQFSCLACLCVGLFFLFHLQCLGEGRNVTAA